MLVFKIPTEQEMADAIREHGETVFYDEGDPLAKRARKDTRMSLDEVTFFENEGAMREAAGRPNAVGRPKATVRY